MDEMLARPPEVAREVVRRLVPALIVPSDGSSGTERCWAGGAQRCRARRVRAACRARGAKPRGSTRRRSPCGRNRCTPPAAPRCCPIRLPHDDARSLASTKRDRRAQGLRERRRCLRPSRKPTPKRRSAHAVSAWRSATQRRPRRERCPSAAKKDIDRTEPRAARRGLPRPAPASRADAPPPAAAPLAKAQADTRTALTAAPTAPMRSVPAAPPPLAGGRLGDRRSNAPRAANSAGAEKAKTGAGQPALRQARSMEPTPGGERLAHRPAPRCNAGRSLPSRRTPAGAAGPLAPLLAAIGADPAQWSRHDRRRRDRGARRRLARLALRSSTPPRPGAGATTGSRGGSTEGDVRATACRRCA